MTHTWLDHWHNHWRKSFDRLLWGITIFLIPSNLFLKLCESCGYAGPVLSDYLIPKLYALDIIIIFLFISRGWRFISEQYKRHYGLWLGWAIIGLCQLFFSSSPVVSISWWLRLTMLAVVGLWLHRKWSHFYTTSVFALSCSLVFQGAVSLGQWFLQKNLFGYWFLGETYLLNTINIVSFVYKGEELIVPYGTTAHPNILGGIAAIMTILLVHHVIQHQMRFSWRALSSPLGLYLSIGMGLLTVGLSYSVSAACVLICGGVVLAIKSHLQQISTRYLALFILTTIVISTGFTWYLGQHYPKEPSIRRRAQLLSKSVDLFQVNPWFGTGLGAFTAADSQKRWAWEPVRFNQPVHHIPLLIATELGIIGLIFSSFLLYILRKNKSLWLALAITLPILIWDHYLWSLTPSLGIVLLLFMDQESTMEKE